VVARLPAPVDATRRALGLLGLAEGGNAPRPGDS
jgi:hypothetical protein